MADNIAVDPGTGGSAAPVATDDVGGAHYQRIKVDLGGDGAASPLVRGQQTAANSLPVVLASDQGTVTITGAVINAGTFAVQVSSSALPTGAATSAKQDTIIGHVDGLEGLLTTIDGDTGTLAGAVSGLEMQVDVVASLPAGTNNIGDVDILTIAAGDNNIGNVDIVTVPADPFGANADAAATAGSTGSIQAKLRLMTSQLDSIKTAVETIDNVVSGSEAQVDVVASLPAGTNAIGKLAANSGVDIGDVDVTSVIPGTGATNLGKAVDGVAGATDTGVAVLAVRDDALTTLTPVDGDYVQLRVGSDGALWVHDTVFGTLNIAVATQADDVANTADSIRVSSFGYWFDGTTWDRAKGDSTDGLLVNLGANNDVNLTQFSGNSVTLGAGAVAAGTLRVTHASDDPVTTALQIIDDWDSTDACKTVTQFATCTTSITRPSDTTAYAANDALSNSTSAPTAGGFTFTSAARASGGSGIITDLIVVSSNDPATLLQGELWIYDSATTAVNDNAAFASSDSDTLLLVAVIPFTMASTVAGSGTTSFAHVSGLSIGYTCVGSANLRFLVKVKNAYTPASAEVLSFRLKCLQVT